MATDFDIVNGALTRIGQDPITEFNDGTPAGNIAGKNYVKIKRAALTGYPWRWASKTETLVALEGDPAPPWLYAYQLPTDLLKLRTVTVEGEPIDYERQFNKLLCDYGTDVDVILKYTWDVPETYWPETFGEALIQRLEAVFLRGIGERFSEAKDRAAEAARTLLSARLEDSQGGQSTRNPVTSPTLQARNGSVPATSRLPWR